MSRDTLWVVLQGGRGAGHCERQAGPQVHRARGGGHEEHRPGQPQALPGRLPEGNVTAASQLNLKKPSPFGFVCFQCVHCLSKFYLIKT